MRKALESHWLIQMADLLVCEVLDFMFGIHAETDEAGPSGDVEMDTVSCMVHGEFEMCLWFSAEPRFFRRLAEQVLGEPPANQEEAFEFGEELINVLGGRFVSEIYHKTGKRARFTPPRYGPVEKKDALATRYFVSEKQEQAEFSWSAVLTEE